MALSATSGAGKAGQHTLKKAWLSLLMITVLMLTGCGKEKETTIEKAFVSDTGYTGCLSGDFGDNKEALLQKMSASQRDRMEKEEYLTILFEQEGNPLDGYTYISAVDPVILSNVEGNWKGQWILSPQGIYSASSYTLMNASDDILCRLAESFESVCQDVRKDENLSEKLVGYDPAEKGNLMLLWEAEDGSYAYLQYISSPYTGIYLSVETGLRKEMEGALSLYHEAAETFPVNAE